MWEKLEEILEGLKAKCQVQSEDTTFGDNQRRRVVNLGVMETHVGQKYWSSVMPTLANAMANVTTILENYSGVDYQCVRHLGCTQNHPFT